MIFWTIAVLATLFSFANYSPIYYHFFGSDMAMQVLMAYDFDVSDSLYYWGQNRLGSLLPLLSLPFVKLGIAPIWVVSIVQYAFLIGTWLFSKIHFERKAYWLIWLLVILFPTFLFKEAIMIGHPYAAQFFLLSWMIWIIKKHEGNIAPQIPILLVLMGLGLWVSEMMIIVPLALAVYVLFNFPLGKTVKKTWQILKSGWLIYIPIVVVFTSAIWYAKTNSIDWSQTDGFLATFNEMGQIFLKTGREYLDEMFLRTESFVGVQYWIFTVMVVAVIVLSLKEKRFLELKRSLLLLLFISSLILLLNSKWVFDHFIATRYFSISYWLFLLFTLSYFSRRKSIAWIPLFICIPIFSFASMQSLILKKSFLPDRWTPSERELFAERFNDVSVIGDYWNSYVMAALTPQKIVAMPHDKELCRNYRYSQNIMKPDTLVLIKDRWLDLYPDTLRQFGRSLKKVREEFIGNHQVGLYVKLPQDAFRIDDFSFPSTWENPHQRSEDEILLISQYNGSIPSAERCRFFLGPGKYKLQLFLRPNTNSFQGELVLNELIENKMTHTVSFSEETYIQQRKIEVDLELSRQSCYEIRLHISNGEMWFSGAKIIEKES